MMPIIKWQKTSLSEEDAEASFSLLSRSEGEGSVGRRGAEGAAEMNEAEAASRA